MMRKNMINMTEEAITADPKGFAKSMVAAKRATTALRILYDFLDCGSVPQSERIVDIIFDVKLAAKKKGFDISDEEALRINAEDAVRNLRHNLCLWSSFCKDKGVKLCGFLGNTREDLVQIYESLYAYQEFIPEAKILLENFN